MQRIFISDKNIKVDDSDIIYDLKKTKKHKMYLLVDSKDEIEYFIYAVTIHEAIEKAHYVLDILSIDKISRIVNENKTDIEIDLKNYLILNVYL